MLKYLIICTKTVMDSSAVLVFPNTVTRHLSNRPTGRVPLERCG